MSNNGSRVRFNNDRQGGSDRARFSNDRNQGDRNQGDRPRDSAEMARATEIRVAGPRVGRDGQGETRPRLSRDGDRNQGDRPRFNRDGQDDGPRFTERSRREAG